MKNIIMVAALLCAPFVAMSQTDSLPTPRQQYEMSKVLEVPRQRINDAGLMHIIGGSCGAVGLGSFAYYLERGGAEAKYSMYSFLGLGVAFNISAGAMHISASRAISKKLNVSHQ